MTEPIIEILNNPERHAQLDCKVHSFRPNQLFAWHELASQRALTAMMTDEEVVPSSAYQALQN